MGEKDITEKTLTSSRLAERAAAPRAGCLEGNIFLSARVCIINFSGGLSPAAEKVCYYPPPVEAGDIPLCYKLQAFRGDVIAASFFTAYVLFKSVFTGIIPAFRTI